MILNLEIFIKNYDNDFKKIKIEELRCCLNTANLIINDPLQLYGSADKRAFKYYAIALWVGVGGSSLDIGTWSKAIGCH